MINLYIFHYHLLPGGVTSVITEGVKALLHTSINDSSIPIGKITLVTGRRENTETVYKSIMDFFPEISHRKIREKIFIDIISEIDYLDKEFAKGENATELARELLNRYGGNESVWWVHNYHLGKNPIFTDALLEIIEKEIPTTPKILLQIHDFPESGRYENLKFLKETIKHFPYPVTPGIRYIVINPRDREILVQSGIPEKLVYLLENPSNIGQLTIPDEKEVANWKEKLLTFYNVNSKKVKLILYPIRAIRRKNVFEAALISAIANNQHPDNNYKLIVTLPGVSKAERYYSSLVEKAFKNGTINGFFKTGAELEKIGISFEELVHTSNIILSSSVQEGFGFSFIQSIIWNKPLFAREIDVLKSFEELFSGYPHKFYSNFLCSIPKSIRKSITEAYKIKVEAISTVLPPRSIERLQREVEQLDSNDTLDFSFLDANTQISILQRALDDKSYIRDILNLNRENIDKFNALMENKIPIEKYKEKLTNIEERFGFSSYSSKFIEIISSFDNSGKISTDSMDTTPEDNIWDNIVDNFAKIEYLRLIYE